MLPEKNTSEMHDINEMENSETKIVEEANRFITENTIPATKGRECVDGRYDQHGVESGMIARPGADFGYIMGLLALRNKGSISLSVSDCVDVVYNAVTSDGDKFYAHSD